MSRWFFRGVILLSALLFLLEGVAHTAIGVSGSDSWAMAAVPEARRHLEISTTNELIRGTIGIAAAILGVLALVQAQRFYRLFGLALCFLLAISAGMDLIPEWQDGSRQTAELAVPAVLFVLGVCICFGMGIPEREPRGEKAEPAS